MHRYALALKTHMRLLSAISVALLVLIIVVINTLLVSKGAPVKDFMSCIIAGYDAVGEDPQTCSDGHATYAAAQPPATKVTSKVGSSVPFTILVTGDSRGSHPAGTLAITTQAEWVAFWNNVHSGLKPMPPLLPVDFTQEMVLTVVQGPVTTSGYSLEPTSVLQSGSDINVTYSQYEPNASCTPTPSTANNYLIITTAKVTGVVTFIPTIRTKKC